MRVNFESKKEFQEQKTILSYKTFKPSEEVLLTGSSSLSSSIIELADHIKGIHGLDYNGIDYNGDEDIFCIKLKKNK